ncbi:hypothetical protein LWI29_034446 [Acer saccharum]|uniref:Uncharacterized protein n=1 Tax=Acer saccharum TaxID=4024 RepID=A0AA39RY05_ACESA|nr:hypothetical protein LWI29_034446 [Acer saccharum]
MCHGEEREVVRLGGRGVCVIADTDKNSHAITIQESFDSHSSQTYTHTLEQIELQSLQGGGNSHCGVSGGEIFANQLW